jgi:hypothetical protein
MSATTIVAAHQHSWNYGADISGRLFKTPGQSINRLGAKIKTIIRYFIPPVAGALALVGGIVLLGARPRQA